MDGCLYPESEAEYAAAHPEWDEGDEMTADEIEAFPGLPPLELDTSLSAEKKGLASTVNRTFEIEDEGVPGSMDCPKAVEGALVCDSVSPSLSVQCQRGHDHGGLHCNGPEDGVTIKWARGA